MHSPKGFAKGGPGAKALAEKVDETIEKNPSPSIHPLYSLEEPLADKIKKVAQKV